MKTKLRLLVLALLALLPAHPVAAQVPDQLKYSIPAPPVGVQSGAQLGYSVAVDGGYIVVGAPLDNVEATDSGVVKVFNTATGALLYLLPNPNPAVDDHFGWSVAISGTRVVVGTPLDGTGNDAGSAYVYDLASPSPTVPMLTLTKPSPLGFEQFGASVSISGNRLVIGAPVTRIAQVNAGSAYVYDLSSATPTVPVATLNNPTPATGDNFGSSVAISGTGIVIGAYQDDTGQTDAGSAYVYNLTSAPPTVPVSVLNNPSPGAGDYFGSSVAIDGTRFVVGALANITGGRSAGSAYIYDFNSPTPTIPILTLNKPMPVSSDRFGISVAISGTRVVVGASGDDTGTTSAGSAYGYDLNSLTPDVPIVTWRNPTPTSSAYFGYSVAISGTRVVAGTPQDDTGATDAGSAYAYDLASATPTVPFAKLNNPGPTLNDHFGASVSVSGTRLVVGVPADQTGAFLSGIAYVFDLASAQPGMPVITLINPVPQGGAGFGGSVAISESRLVVGTSQKDYLGYRDSGGAYVYDLGSATPTVPIVTLNNPNPADDDYFGNSVAISGTLIVIGARRSFNRYGRAHVYDIGTATPTVPIATLDNPSPNGVDEFGTSVSISGTRVVVGAPADTTGGSFSGRAYVYDIASATPTLPMITLNNPSATPPGDQFGNSVAISGTRVVVGASLDDVWADASGTAYVYDISSATPTVPVITLTNPARTAGDRFGSEVAISGTRIVVAAYLANTGATDSGAAYVFDLSSSTPAVEVATLNNPFPAVQDYFGWSVAIDGTTIAIGALRDDTTTTDKGAAYVFGPSPYSLWKATVAGDQFVPDLADTDSDGVRTLAEYSLLRLPTIPEGAATTAAPALYAEGERLRMFVPRDPARNDITLEVQSTGDLLGPWTTIATSTLGAPFSGPGYFGGDSATPGVKSVEVRDTVNLRDAPQRFLRVKVRR